MKFFFITLLIICLFNFSCTLNKNSVVINPPKSVETTINCSYPFDPTPLFIPDLGFSFHKS